VRKFYVRSVGGGSQAIAQVTGLTGAATGVGQITLNWTAVFGALNYTVRRNGTVIATLIVGTSYMDTGLPNATLETYTVSAVGVAGEGLPSAPVFVMTVSGHSGPTPTSMAAATATANNNSLNGVLKPFYWEIGDSVGKIVGGSVGVATASNTGVSTAQLAIGQPLINSTRLSIASASKMVYGCYVTQWRGGAANLTTGPLSDVEFLHMTSGYSNLPSTECQGIPTVTQCVLSNGTANTQTPGEEGFFHYDGGHFEKHGQLYTPLANLSLPALTAAYRAMLNVGTTLQFTQPLLAGGLFGSSDDYALVLRGILNGPGPPGLLMHDALGINQVCTWGPPQGGPCASAVYSPVAPFNWQYSTGHWVETDATLNNDGAFSSPGSFGFYPWIDATKTYYGTISVQTPVGGKGHNSASLGQLIRRAFMTGIEQTGTI
jgi:hypothetical protein